MKTLYIGKDFKLYVTNSDDRIPVETDIFDGFCNEYIEGHIFVPEGMTMVNQNGETVHGQFVQPWKNTEVLTVYQEQYESRQHEQQLLAEYESALAEIEKALGV